MSAVQDLAFKYRRSRWATVPRSPRQSFVLRIRANSVYPSTVVYLLIFSITICHAYKPWFWYTSSPLIFSCVSLQYAGPRPRDAFQYWTTLLRSYSLLTPKWLRALLPPSYIVSTSSLKSASPNIPFCRNTNPSFRMTVKHSTDKITPVDVQQAELEKPNIKSRLSSPKYSQRPTLNKIVWLLPISLILKSSAHAKSNDYWTTALSYRPPPTQRPCSGHHVAFNFMNEFRTKIPL